MAKTKGQTTIYKTSHITQIVNDPSLFPSADFVFFRIFLELYLSAKEGWRLLNWESSNQIMLYHKVHINKEG